VKLSFDDDALAVVANTDVDVLLADAGELSFNDVRLGLLGYVDVRAEGIQEFTSMEGVGVGEPLERRRAEEGFFEEAEEGAEFIEE